MLWLSSITDTIRLTGKRWHIWIHERPERAHAGDKSLYRLPVTCLHHQAHPRCALHTDVSNLKHRPLPIVVEAPIRAAILVRVLPVVANDTSIIGQWPSVHETAQRHIEVKFSV